MNRGTTGVRRSFIRERTSTSKAAIRTGHHVVFDFLVYENPPSRVADYQRFLEGREIPFATRVLRPSLETILARQRTRGRATDRSLADRRRHTENQLTCLHSSMILPEWVVDSSNETAEETYSLHFADLVEGREASKSEHRSTSACS